MTTRNTSIGISVSQQVWARSQKYAQILTALMLSATLLACGREPPPDFLSIDSAFSEAEAETIRSAADAWCDAVGWCPEEVIWADRGRITLVDDLPSTNEAVRACPPGATCTVSARWLSGGNILIARNRLYPDDLGWLWTYTAHEMGHHCSDHLDTGLMSTLAFASANTIDDAAIKSWRQGCGQ